MKTLPTTASDDDIKALVVDWSELLAAGLFQQALDMFPCSNEEMGWNPDSLANWISNYGFDEPYPDGKTYRLTSLRELDNFEEIVEKSIDVDRENLYGLSAQDYIGMVHYDDVPLDGKTSDLTARFRIKKVGKDQITLEFLDIHVM